MKIFTNISVRIPSNENNSNTFSEGQLEKIKETVLLSILEILPTIINEVTPVLVKVTGKLIEERIRESLPTTANVLATQSQSRIESPPTQARNFEQVNEGFLNKNHRNRKDAFRKFSRSTELAELYKQCLAEEPPYVPRKFREDTAHIISAEDKLVYDKFGQQKLEAEINILSLRAINDEERITQIDEEICFQFQFHMLKFLYIQFIHN